MIPIRYNLRSLVQRKATTFATALGIGLVVFVLASALMLAAGIRKTLEISGRTDMAVVMRKGSDSELNSSIEDPSVAVVLVAPGVKRDGSGPIAAGESVVVAAMSKVGTKGFANVQIRGVTDQAVKLRPEVHVIAGRMPAPGSDEVMVGQRLRGRFEGLDLGQSFEVRKGRKAQVVGIFAANGSSYESEVWLDREVLRSWYHRQGRVNSVRVQLDSAAAFETFRTTVESDKRLGLTVLREDKYYQSQSEETGTLISVLGSVIAVFFAIGATIGATITMYSAVSNRQREIGTLRALGFSQFQILTSFLLESLTLALLGGVAGAVASLGMTLVKFSTMNATSWSEIVFEFHPTPQILGTAVGFAVTMGILGGFFPAVRAARVTPVQALRA